MAAFNTEHNILKSPILKAGVDYATRVAVCIDLFCRDTNGIDKKVGSGTGFFHRRADMTFLITNWHVLTGRDPQHPETLLDGYPASPSGFQVHLARIKDPNHFVPSEIIALYEDSVPQWIEARVPNLAVENRIDLAAIPFKFPAAEDGPLVTTIEQFAPSNKDFLLIGRDVVIVGYPFGLSAENPYPLWKRGYVASEPSKLIGGLPKFYIDSPGRPGMSGSPVFMISEGIGLSAKAHELMQKGNGNGALEILAALNVDELANAPEVNILKFAGVYSGSVGDRSLEQMRVGVAWHAAMVDMLFTHPAEGANPYPPLQ